jgi:hypothetical protein
MMNTIGMGNVALGASAGPAANNLTNTSSIGAGASASGSNTLILGDNFVNVGIGLSAPAVPPATKLEIDAGLAGTAPGGTGNNGNSGLRFRDLTSLSIPQNNPGNGVLALNNQGDVIYVNAPVGGGGGVGKARSMQRTKKILFQWVMLVGRCRHHILVYLNRKLVGQQLKPMPGIFKTIIKAKLGLIISPVEFMLKRADHKFLQLQIRPSM